MENYQYKRMNRPDKQINHPGRNYPLQYFNYHCVAATPPSKGGENVMKEMNFIHLFIFYYFYNLF